MGISIGALAAAGAQQAITYFGGGALLASIGGAIAGGIVSRALGGGGSEDNLGSGPQSNQINAASPVAPIMIPYGTVHCGGARIYTEVAGDQSWYLYYAVVWGEGPISAIRQVYFDGTGITDGRYYGRYNVEHRYGSDTQTAPAMLLGFGQWTEAHRALGCAWSAFGLFADFNAFNGLPQTTADVDGRTLYDTRSGVTGFSRNPALMLRDYLTDTRYGRGIPEASIDDASFETAADYCDERVDVPRTSWGVTVDASANSLTGAFAGLLGTTDGVRVSSDGVLPAGLAADTTYYVVRIDVNTVCLATSVSQALADNRIDLLDAGSGTITVTHWDQARYTCDVELSPDAPMLDNLNTLRATCRGWLIYSGGLYRLVCDKAETPTSFEFNEDNIVGGWSIATSSKRTRWNRVKARYANPGQLWQPDVVVYESAAHRVDDRGLLLEQEILLAGVTDPYRAHRIAQQEERQSRFGITVEFTATLEGLQCEIGDVVPITHSTPGWTAKPFRILRIRLLSTDEVQVTGREYDDSVYVLDDMDPPRSTVATNLPDPSTVATPGAPEISEELYETTGSAGVKSRVVVSWVAPSDAFVIAYLVDYKGDNDTDWIPLGQVRETRAVINDVTPGVYDFRVRAINVLGAISTANSSTREVLGLYAAPSDVVALTVVNSNGFGLATWDLHTDLDVRLGGRIEIRHSPLTSGATWPAGVLVGNFDGAATRGLVPMRTGTYMAKAVDSSDHYSAGIVSSVLTEGMITGLSTVGSLTEDAAFSGTKTSCVLSGSVLQLSGSTLWDSLPGNVDDYTDIDSAGGQATSGEYLSSTYIDGATVATRRWEAHIKMLGVDNGDLVDARTANIDRWGSVDGTEINDAAVELYIATTNDNPAGAPTWSSWIPWHVGDFNCRAAKFRAVLSVESAEHNVQISELRFAAKA